MSHKKYIKEKYLHLKNQLGGIDSDFTMFTSCIGKPSKPSSVKIRTRTELIDFLKSKKSISDIEAKILDRQLEIIKDYIQYGERRNPYPNFLQNYDEIILREIAKMALIVCTTSGKYPRENQLIAVLQFFEGKNTLLQAGTGQGKSLIVAMIAILQKRLKIPYIPNDSRPVAVHVITATDDLALDGRTSQKKLFDAYGIRVRGIDEAGNSDDIIYGTPFDFERQALGEASDLTIPRQLLDTKVRRTIILDESDSHLVDGAMGRVLTPDPDPDKDIIKQIFIKISNDVIDYYANFFHKYSVADMTKIITEMNNEWVTKNHSRFVDRWNLDKTVWINNAFTIYHPNKFFQDGTNYILKKSLLDEIETLKTDNPSLNISSLLSAINVFHKNYNNPEALKYLKTIIQTWNISSDLLPPESKSRYNRIIDIFENILLKNKEQVYGLLFMGSIQYYDIGTGQVISNMKYSHGIQELLEYKHFKTIFTEPTISVRSYSLFKYVRSAELIFGLSGTVGLDQDTMDFQKKVWNIQKPPVILPEFAVPQLVEIQPNFHLEDEKTWNFFILRELNLNKKRPILIIVENPERARYVSDLLIKNSYKPSIYESSSDKHLLEEILGPGRIIITTNLGGRGSDYQYDEKLAPQGLHVIIGFDSDEERILAQARGRAGRAGKPGTWAKISFGQKLKQKPELKNIKDSVRNAIAEDIIFDIYLFIKYLVKDSEPRTQILKSWLSKKTVKEFLITNLTKYDANEHQMHLLAGFILTEWLKEDQPTSKYVYDKSNPVTIALGNFMRPYLIELNRLS
jgi:preprotein translocase subunit SecA